ncbi:Uncharacterized protein TCM_022739 [Theobroma cacao]|uniref:Chromo domain-containing protein n=1 Tax=Theobroma cacao TaxID=3641 RepID=A0A061EVD6_THECC|nr:Uncharacterized protein TCM_022739 [Theobroma cacao]
MLSVMSIQVTGFEELKNQYSSDSYFSKIIADLQGSLQAGNLPYRLHEDYLFKGNQLCIPEGSLREQIIRELHGNGLGGHFGRDKTLAMVADRYYWPKMRRDVERLVKRCPACLFGKGSAQNTSLYVPLPEPDAPWIHLKVVNRSLGNMLRCLIQNNPKTWDLVIPQAEFAYNNSVNRSIKKTPFEAAYGLKPQHVLDLVPLPQEARVSNEGKLFADHIRKIHEEVKAALKASNAEYSFTANQHRRKQEFEEGDQVFVHLRQKRFPKGTYHKLKFRKFGPCKVLKKISSNAYLIELPPELQISPIFNILDLYPFDGCDGTASTIDAQIQHLPIAKVEVIEDVLDVKEVRSRRGNPYRRLLVKWLGKPANESTWIAEEELK